MKKIFLALSFFFCGVVLFLATVDLSPYLAPETTSNEIVTVEPLAIADEPVSTATASHPVLAAKTGKTVEIADPTVTAITPSNSGKTKPAIAVVQEKTMEQASTVPPVEPETSKIPENPVKPHTAFSRQSLVAQPAPQEPIQQDPDCQTLSPGEYPFSILLETFDAKETAINAVPLYQKKSIKSYWVKVDLGSKGIKYRLFSGVFRDREQAERFAQHNGLANKPIKRTRYSSRIDTGNDTMEIADLKKAALQSGTIPYLLCTEEGLHFMYVGAFYTIAGAKAQCEELSKAGISCSAESRRVTAGN